MNIAVAAAAVICFFFFCKSCFVRPRRVRLHNADHPPTFDLLHEDRSRMQQLKRQDGVGLVLFCGGLILFIMGLSWGGTVSTRYPPELELVLTVFGSHIHGNPLMSSPQSSLGSSHSWHSFSGTHTDTEETRYCHCTCSRPVATLPWFSLPWSDPAYTTP